VVGLGHVADNVLPFVYAAADAVVYPSAYEGFGFPVLEGMASGVPVVTTRAPGVEEVAGDACLLVEPGEAAELADALIRVAEDQDLRANLIRRGGERAARYTWKETAARTLVVCERAAQA
jgi:glycosyltransferase involved in cell wall biosynthesis